MSNGRPGQPGIVKYNELMAVGQYKEAMEYADQQATASSEVSDAWLELASSAHVKLINQQQEKKP